ncbi:MAG: molybdate ABC transporter substrate-binding protein [Caldilineaceae bacterium]
MRKLFYIMFVLLALSLVAAGCRPVSAPAPGSAPAAGEANAAPITLNVFAAASLTDAFNEIGKQFAAEHAGADVVFNFAGSNQLATQIGQGAPADVFASANKAQMQAAIDSGRIVSGTQQTFVRNRLVAVTPADNPAQLAGLQDLAKPGIKIVLAAKEVPVGQYALDFLDKAEADGSLGAGYKDAVLANVVSYEENVRSVLAKVALGEADAGIVYTSDAAVSKGEVQQIEIPDALNTIATYPIATLSDSQNPELAKQFLDYVLSPAGQQVLEQYGFIGAGGK